MKFDQLLTDHLGTMGRFQLLVVAIACSEEVFLAIQSLAPVFMAGVPEHSCRHPQARDTLPANCNRQGVRRITVPFEKDPDNGALNPSGCHMYAYNLTELTDDIVDEACYGDPETAFNNSKLLSSSNMTTAKCDSWDYASEDFTSTVVTEWDLVCSKKSMVATVSAVFLGGRAVGNLVFGWMADRYGRRKVIMLCGILSLVCGIVCALSPFYLMFVIVRFFQAFFASGRCCIASVIIVEYSGPDRRVAALGGFMMCWAVGCMVLSPVAYLIRDWRRLLLATTIPELMFCTLFYFLVPESPRWLYLQRRHEEADRIVIKMAQWNRKILPSGFKVDASEKSAKSSSPLDLFRTRYVCRMTMVFLWIWAAAVFVYYGVTFNTGNLGGNLYVNFFIAAAVEVPANVFIVWSFGRFGHVLPLGVSLVCSGLALLFAIAVPVDMNWLLVTLSMIGKFFIAAAFNMNWIVCAESYPTSIRNIGLSITSVAGRVAAPISPYIDLLADTHRILPLLLCGVIALLGGGLAFTLPETHDQPMTQTIEEAEQFIRDHRKSCCRPKCCRRPTAKPVNEFVEDEMLQADNDTTSEAAQGHASDEEDQQSLV